MGGDKVKSICDSTVVKVTTPPPVEQPTRVLDEKESFLSIGSQIIVPFIVAGIAMVGAGIYLDLVQKWDVFVNVTEIIILVPALLGLKGNLEMTLASRLSTEANLGTMNDKKELWSMVIGNITLVQCQAIVIGLLSSIVAILMVRIFRSHFDISHTLLLCACSILTASIASFILGLLTSGIIVISLYFKINPDNVATPIAASFGDITSLILLSHIGSFLYMAMGTYKWLPITIICFYLLLMPLWVWITYNNKYTQNVLTTGWSPIIIAMLISTLGGMALDTTVKHYEGLSAFQPVINGVGGNLVSIQASRLSTALHKQTVLGRLPPNCPIVPSVWRVFWSSEPYSLTARVLISFVVPGHIIFVYCIAFFRGGTETLGPVFLIMYMTAAMIQVAALLYMAYVLTHYFWLRGVNPDNTTIPYLTALGDLLGIILLGVTFKVVELCNEK